MAEKWPEVKKSEEKEVISSKPGITFGETIVPAGKTPRDVMAAHMNDKTVYGKIDIPTKEELAEKIAAEKNALMRNRKN